MCFSILSNLEGTNVNNLTYVRKIFNSRFYWFLFHSLGVLIYPSRIGERQYSRITGYRSNTPFHHSLPVLSPSLPLATPLPTTPHSLHLLNTPSYHPSLPPPSLHPTPPLPSSLPPTISNNSLQGGQSGRASCVSMQVEERIWRGGGGGTFRGHAVCIIRLSVPEGVVVAGITV